MNCFPTGLRHECLLFSNAYSICLRAMHAIRHERHTHNVEKGIGESKYGLRCTDSCCDPLQATFRNCRNLHWNIHAEMTAVVKTIVRLREGECLQAATSRLQLHDEVSGKKTYFTSMILWFGLTVIVLRAHTRSGWTRSTRIDVWL